MPSPNNAGKEAGTSSESLSCWSSSSESSPVRAKSTNVGCRDGATGVGQDRRVEQSDLHELGEGTRVELVAQGGHLRHGSRLPGAVGTHLGDEMLFPSLILTRERVDKRPHRRNDLGRGAVGKRERKLWRRLQGLLRRVGRERGSARSAGWNSVRPG
eukprot:SAG11_NODE_12279_length_711_cov_1.065359_2_plen_156_part_01